MKHALLTVLLLASLPGFAQKTDLHLPVSNERQDALSLRNWGLGLLASSVACIAYSGTKDDTHGSVTWAVQGGLFFAAGVPIMIDAGNKLEKTRPKEL